jgi:aminopeptidase YwaD
MRKILFLLLISLSSHSFGQDSTYSRKTLNTLTSSEFWGRGYTKDGMKKAGDFIASEFESFGLKPMDEKDYRQYFHYSVNTFPGQMEVSINGKKLTPGKDFIIEQASVGFKLNDAPLTQLDSTSFAVLGEKVIIKLEDKLTWSVSQGASDYLAILVNKNALNDIPKTLSTNIENRVIPEFKAANICAMVKGTAQPDSIVILTAHYDHLGGMGASTYFPGANDNASGVSLLLSLAKHYAKYPQKYSMAFICFAGEEAGILGSKYFTENPLIPLKNIRFLFNIDMVGTGEAGATVVNATQYPAEFALLKQVNDKGNLLVRLNSRGKAANSDHYFFAEKGVPSFFLYTQGGIAAYHDIFDRPETLPFTVYEKLFKLFLGFSARLMN